MHPYTPTAATEAAARARFEAQRTGEPEALSLLSRQAAAAAFRAHNEASKAARQRDANRQDALGPAGREAERQAAAYSYR